MGWEVLPLSLLGIVETVKMNVLLQSLPVKVPMSTFKTLDRMISKFIWIYFILYKGNSHLENMYLIYTFDSFPLQMS